MRTVSSVAAGLPPQTGQRKRQQVASGRELDDSAGWNTTVRLLVQGTSTLAAVGSLAVLDWGWGLPSLAAVGLTWAGSRRRYVLPDVLVGLGLGVLAPGLLLLGGCWVDGIILKACIRRTRR